MERSLQISPRIRSVAQCTRALEIPLRPQWPSALPGIAINAELIIGFDRAWALDYSVPEADAKDFADQWIHIFTTALPSLSWVELILFTEKARQRGGIPLQELWAHYGYRDFSSYDEMASVVLSLPLITLQWLQEKKMGPQELQVLRALKTDTEKQMPTGFWLFLSERSLSRQEGAQALELWLELRLMGKTEEELSPATDESSSQWIQRLKSLRYPETQRRDQGARQWIDAQTWPRPSQIRWLRQGDQSGLEIRLVLKKPADVDQGRKALEDIESLLAQAPESVWQKH